MAQAGWIERLFGGGAQRDGQAHAIEALATDLDVGEVPATQPAAGGHAPALPDEPRNILIGALATKILYAHLQNRHQTLYPLTMNFGSLRPAEKALLVEAMALSMLADGAVGDGETEGIAASLRMIGGGEGEHELLKRSFQQPRALSLVLGEIQAANLSALAYAASLIAIDQRQTVNQLYLEYLAGRLALPSEVVISLNRRYVR